MEYQKNINLLKETSNNNSKVKARKQVEVNDQSRSNSGKDSHFMFDISLVRSNFCDYEDAYIFVK